MAKLGCDLDEDDLTPSFSEYSNSESSTSLNDNSSSMSSYSDGGNEEERCERFRIMDLPVEIRAKIFNMINQRQVKDMRLVCRRWLQEVDQFYEFIFNIYDTTNNLSYMRNLRCRECVIWKLTREFKSEPIFNHPTYLKVIKVYGPTSPENLRMLISSSCNLEHLTLTRRANYPWILNLQDTPALKNLTELRYLRLNSEEHLQIRRPMSSDQKLVLKVPPMMDCFFPKLKVFEILKRFPVWHYSHYVTSVLKFVSRHASSLTHIELDFIPLSCIAWLGDNDLPGDEDGSSEEDEYRLGLEPVRRIQRKLNSNEKCISAQEVNLTQLCTMRLQKLCITTMGYAKDIHIWRSVLESQAIPQESGQVDYDRNISSYYHGLRELRFDWVCPDAMTETKARVSGFPWIHFQKPIEACSQSLVHVELANLSMVSKTYPSSPLSGEKRPPPSSALFKITPFDLSIFRQCTRLKSLILRCRENHARISPVDQGPSSSASHLQLVRAGENIKEDNNVGEPANVNAAFAVPPAEQNQQRGVIATVGEVLLMINAMDLPESLEQLEIFRFPLLTSDIESCVRKLVNLRKLFFHECGKTNNFGVSADIIRLISRLRQLKFLEIVGFNDSTEEKKAALELVFQQIGRPFEGQDTWLELCDGSTTAYDTLLSIDQYDDDE